LVVYLLVWGVIGEGLGDDLFGERFQVVACMALDDFDGNLQDFIV
jgi:hypothetical protein